MDDEERERRRRRVKAILRPLSPSERARVVTVVGRLRAARKERQARREIEELLELPPGGPSKTYGQLLAEGISHHGGLASLADAEAKGVLFGGPARPEAANENVHVPPGRKIGLAEWLGSLPLEGVKLNVHLPPRPGDPPVYFSLHALEDRDDDGRVFVVGVGVPEERHRPLKVKVAFAASKRGATRAEMSQLLGKLRAEIEAWGGHVRNPT